MTSDSQEIVPGGKTGNKQGISTKSELHRVRSVYTDKTIIVITL